MNLKAFFETLSHMTVEVECYDEMLAVNCRTENWIIDFYGYRDDNYTFKIDQFLEVKENASFYLQHQPTEFQKEWMASILKYFTDKLVALKEQLEEEFTHEDDITDRLPQPFQEDVLEMLEDVKI